MPGRSRKGTYLIGPSIKTCKIRASIQGVLRSASVRLGRYGGAVPISELILDTFMDKLLLLLLKDAVHDLVIFSGCLRKILDSVTDDPKAP